MADSDETPSRGKLVVVAMLAAGSVLLPGTARAAPASAQQELVGSSRQQPSVRPALAEHAEALPASLPAIHFARGSAQLTPSATRQLDTLGRSLAQERLRIEGHADADTLNRDLAGRRAQAVADYLQQNCGVPAERLDVTTGTRVLKGQVRLVELGS